MNERKRRLWRISAVIAVVALAAAAMGASAAQAAIWHRNTNPLTAELPLTNYPGVGSFEMRLSSPNPVHIVCQAPSTYGANSKAWAETKFATNTYISGCKTYRNANNEYVKNCDQLNPNGVTLNLLGTGEKVASNPEVNGGKILFGELCELGYQLQPVVTSMSLEWPSDVNHPKDGIEHEVKGSGSGYLGNKPMTVTYTNTLKRYAPEGDTWGWY